jgi:hypothetical protein
MNVSDRNHILTVFFEVSMAGPVRSLNLPIPQRYTELHSTQTSSLKDKLLFKYFAILVFVPHIMQDK